MPSLQKFVLPIIILLVIFGPGLLIAAEDGADSGRDSPVMLLPSNNTIRIDTVMAFPFPDTVAVPIIFGAAAADSISRFEFELSYPSDDLTYIGYTLDSTSWSGNIIAYSDAPNLEIQGSNDLLTGSTGYTLIRLLFAVDSVGFDHTMNLTFHPDIYFNKYGQGASYDPIPTDGWVKTYGDSLYIDVLDATGYSYQALDTSSATKSVRYVNVPVKMYASFPCSEFKFWVRYCPSYSDSGLIFAGYTNGRYGATAAIDANDSTLIQIDNIANPQTFDLAGYFYVIYLRFRVGDFHELYNDTCTFSGSLPITAYQTPDDYLKGANSEFKYDLDSLAILDGQVNLPQYKVYLYVSSSHVAVDSSLTVPVRMKTTFWSQYYKTYIKFDSTYLHLDSVTSARTGSNPVPGHISYSYESSSGTFQTYEVVTDSIFDYEFLSPNSTKTIYNLHFTPTDSMYNNPGTSTQISFNTLTEVNEVRDYFPPEDSLDMHIFKYSTCCDSTFNTYSGYASMPIAMVYAEEDVPCTDDSATVPVHIQWIGRNDTYAVRLVAHTEGPLLFRGIVEDTTDYFIRWGTPLLQKDNQIITVEGEYPPGEIDGPGILLHLAMSGDKAGDQTMVYLDEAHFTYSGGVIFATTVPGWVNPAKKIKSKDEPPKTPPKPATPRLIQNHPNPFNAVTAIEFNLVNEAQVTIDIYDIMGRKVRRLVSSEFPSGTHKIIWDCKNQANEDVSTGFYIYTLTTDKYQESKKMLLLK